MEAGVWVAENLVHLCLVSRQLAPDPPEWAWSENITTLHAAPAGSTSAGFSAERLADKLGVSLDELLEANRRGLLNLVVSRVRCDCSASLGVRFTFTYGIRTVDVVSCFKASRPAAQVA